MGDDHVVGEAEGGGEGRGAEGRGREGDGDWCGGIAFDGREHTHSRGQQNKQSRTKGYREPHERQNLRVDHFFFSNLKSDRVVMFVYPETRHNRSAAKGFLLNCARP